MQILAKRIAKPKKKEKNLKPANGIENLVSYYESLFDIEENVNHYSAEDYQNAKRKFVKHLLQTRTL